LSEILGDKVVFQYVNLNHYQYIWFLSFTTCMYRKFNPVK